MTIRFKKMFDDVVLPFYATEGSAGMDLVAYIKEDIVISPRERVIIGTGLKMALSSGYEAQIRPRSGMAIKYGLTVVNAPGTIDSDYRGEIKVALINLSDENFTVSNGMRIAQMVISKYARLEVVEVSELDDTIRGEGGFGSTGEK